jgi:hypothetical protein
MLSLGCYSPWKGRKKTPMPKNDKKKRKKKNKLRLLLKLIFKWSLRRNKTQKSNPWIFEITRIYDPGENVQGHM